MRVHLDTVFKFCRAPQFFSDRMTQQVNEVFFYILPEKMRGDLYGQDIALKFQWYYRFKPSAETRRLNIILNDIQTIIPYNFVRGRNHILIRGFWYTKMVEKNGKKK
jgi:hypothetical protein